MAPSFTCSLATAEDIPHLVDIMTQSMSTNALNLALFEEGYFWESCPKFYHGLIHQYFGRPKHYLEKVTRDDTSQIVGWIGLALFDEDWQKNPQYNAAASAADIHGMKQQFARDFYDPLEESYNKHMGGKKHAVLRSMYLLQEYENYNLSNELIYHLHNKYYEGLPTWCVVRAKFATSLRRLGFQDVDHVDIDLEKYMGEFTGYGVHRSYHLLLSPGKLKERATLSTKL